MMELEERFWIKADWSVREPGCWNWRRPGRDGYGRFRLGGRYVVAHRIAYELEVGEIPPGMQLDHLCRNRACVNPDHLEPVTASTPCEARDLRPTTPGGMRVRRVIRTTRSTVRVVVGAQLAGGSKPLPTTTERRKRDGTP